MKAILHIGAEKTGSTSIQKAMLRNKSALNGKKIHYSELRTNAGRHDFLPFISSIPRIAADFAELIAEFGTQSIAGDGIRRRLSQEIDASAYATMLFSSEHCHSRLFTTSCVAKLRDFLSEFFDDVDVILYLRRQDRLAVSYFSTHLRFGGMQPDPFAATDRGVLNYEHLLDRWATAFGASKIHVYIYDDIARQGASIVQHFSQVLGIADFRDDCFENARLDPIEQEVMRQINAQMSFYNGNTVRSAIALVSKRATSKLRSNVCREAALAYMREFEQSNEVVRQAFFPDRRSLFDEDFYEYDEQPLSKSYSEAVTTLAIDALAEAGRIISNLEQQIQSFRNASG